ncbi:MAG: 16S rRNA (uracil(1498)-N(3))-methyltransferase, partial [Clostridia bacterium]|nr:16S rRNA (uracil(1498)-N(3))-methyltransferase [Clostridia bacterium]
MPKFFTDNPIVDNTVTIQGEDAAHLRLALRVKPGEVITVCDAQGWDCRCEITAVDAQTVTCSVLEKQPCKAENPYFTTLYLCLTKGDKFELVIQKAVELGADRIVPVLSERCISRPDAKDAAKKVDRWQKIALSAAKQCGRGKIPEVTSVC